MSAAHPLSALPSGFLVDCAWLAAHLDDPRLRILDATTHLVPREDRPYDVVSGAADFERGHIPGARHADIDGALSDPDHALHFMVPPAQRFAAGMAALGVSDDSLVVTYATANYWWASRLWWLLRLFGHDAVAVLDGGFQRWRALGLPVAQGAPAAAVPGQFSPRPARTSRVAARDDVLQALGQADTSVLNALRPEQHAGTGGTHYGRPGHIRGSINVPAVSLVDADNCYHSPEALRQLLAPALAQPQVITYCGGGIAASATTLALEMLGHPGVRLYDASLSEWAPDPSLPMARS